MRKWEDERAEVRGVKRTRRLEGEKIEGGDPLSENDF